MPSFPVLRSLKVFLFLAVAAVCDRRHCQESGGHRPPLQAPRWSLNRNPFTACRETLKDQRMKKVRFVLPVLAGVLLVSTMARAQFASSVIAYTPGTGAAAGFTNQSTVLGPP